MNVDGKLAQKEARKSYVFRKKRDRGKEHDDGQMNSTQVHTVTADNYCQPLPTHTTNKKYHIPILHTISNKTPIKSYECYAS